jgi:hypothetical protein
MYSGGHSYFRKTLKRFNQPASYFALQNDHWLLVGLDTAYEEGKLANDQLAWLSQLMATAGNRRIILFTHHQLFSWAEDPSTELQAQVVHLLRTKRIFGWYWGHEHRCMLYDKHPFWGLYGRCVGHSGYPYFRDNFTEGTIIERGPQDTAWRRVEEKNMVPGGLILEGPNMYIPGYTEEYGPNGYVTLQLTGAHINELVHMPDGSVAYERELV